ncbi:WYL domain-containing protein [Dyadobacter sp. MSC1_007]|jgi:hypothetical protein|uniref:WYL domain-containing protein n=1 Tax=Dyadobacter sp. MSC1_007 TaxID=2909264 RepID=UPI00203043A7|nr:WYL domain-containing protein [Dyadobacter sp. MSC1_007]
MSEPTNTQPGSTPHIAIGSIVSLKTHPYPDAESDVIVGGDTTHISPFMIVVETQKNFKTTYDEHTGVKQDELSVKCLFFSTKDQFEEVWLSSKLLKTIKSNDSQDFIERSVARSLPEIYQAFISKQVSLTTLNLELGKRKSYMRSDENNLTSGRTRVEGLLTYLSPVMQIVEIKRYDHKDPLYDSRRGEQKRFVPKWVVRCKWFNSESSKFHEKFIAADALQLIPEIKPDAIKFVRNLIGQGKYISLNDGQVTRVIAPKAIFYRSGYFHVSAFDYILNSIIDIQLIDNEPIGLTLDSYFSESYPDFNFDDGTVSTPAIRHEQMISAIEEARKSNSFIRIKYININENVSSRTLDSFKVVKISEDEKIVEYLIGHCNLRNAERTFRIDRIQKLEILNAKFNLSI